MRIHRLTLTHVKGVADREIVFPEEGVVVVEGANEAGKTTMIEALDLLFDEKDSSRKRHVLAMRPVGLDVPSAVEAEVSSGPYRFTYRKQWFRKPGTVLTVTQPRRETLTGTAAHDRARAILAETTDLDLWHALRLMQATPLGATDLSGSSALADALEEAAGTSADSAGSEGDSLLAAAQEAYLEFFTPTGRPTGEYRESQARLEQAEAERDAAQAAVDEVALEVRRHAEVVRESSRLEGRLEQAEATHEDVREQWSRAEAVLAERARLAASVAVARDSADAAAERAATRADLVAEAAARQERVTRAQEDVDRVVGAATPQEEMLVAAVAAVDLARTRREQARREVSRAEADTALLADLSDLADAVDRLRRAEPAADAVAAARQRCPRPFGGDLEAIEAAVRDLDLARAELRGGSAAWRLTPMADGVEIDLDGQRVRLDAVRDGVLTAPTTIDVPGVVSLRLDPPNGAGERAAAVERSERHLADLLAEGAVSDAAAARDAVAAHADGLAEIAEAERALATVLAGTSLPDLRRHVEQLAHHAGELLDRRRAEAGDEGAAPEPVSFEALDVDELDVETVTALARWVAGAVDRAGEDQDAATTGTHPDRSATAGPAAGVVREARRREDEAAAEVARCEAEASALRSTVEARRLEVARVETALAAATQAAQEAQDRLAAARERRSDEVVEAQEREARSALATAETAEAQVAEEVTRLDPDSLRVRLEGARSAAESLRTRHAAMRDERLGIEARLRHAGEQGRADRLTEAETALAHARRVRASFERRAAAARTLYEALSRHHDEVARSYVEPFGRAVSRLGRVVHGPDFDVEVGQGLTIDARIVGDQRIPYEALSSGAKEQMSILTRLATASLVAPEQGAPVIIDDALGYSDPDRLQRMCAAFSLAAGGAQIILLTCTPGRYAAIPDAHVIQV